MEESAASKLCRSCGLCCSGVLFDKARAAPHPSAHLAALGLAMVEGDDKWFSLPCPHHDGLECTIYSRRPRICGDYRCALLERVDEGRAGLEEARGIVAKARALVADLTRREPRLAFLAERRRLRDRGHDGGEATPDGKARAARLYLETIALDRFLTKHFRGVKKPGVPAGDMGAGSD